ncbi:MAG: hypothetical protein ABI852_01010 [Gemmatimonadaceae bacterium]
MRTQMRNAFTRAVAGSVMLLMPVALSAQGTISTQGFGYPLAGTSTRAAGTAGALLEFDLLSPRNPSSLTGLGRAVLAVQAEPELRTLTFNSIKENSRVQRVPLLMAGVRLSSKAVLSFSSAGFLDRNYTTTSAGEALVGNVVLPTKDVQDMRGSIADLRAGLGYRVLPRLSIGLAGHVFTGSNKLDLLRTFDDSTGFGKVNETSGVAFFGKALSFGSTLLLPKGFLAAASFRKGFGIEADNGDTVLTRAKIPDRIGAGLLYTGFAGSSFAFNVDKTKWSSMQKLGTSLLQTHDATNWSAGGEVSTARVRGSPVLLRAGAGKNTLPFGLNGGTVTEQRFAGGAAVAITSAGRDQAVLDFSVTRANRKLSGSTAKEGAWLLGIGIQIRP